MSEETHRLPRPRWPVAAMGAAAAAALAALGIAVGTPDLPGSESMSFEDVVDVVAILAFGVLGAVLVRRNRAAGLGTALVVLGVLESLVYLLGGLADLIAQGQPDPPAIAQLCSLASTAAFIATFSLFVLSPLLLFPTGRVPSRRWRWATGAAVMGSIAAMLSVLLAPGPVDEDNPAWGENPIGFDALAGLTHALEVIGLALLAIGLLSGLAAYATRCVRYRGARRRQMAWFTMGVVTMIGGLIIDTEGKSVVLETLLALVIFGTMLVGIGWPLLGPLGRAADLENPPPGAEAEGDPTPELVRPTG